MDHPYKSAPGRSFWKRGFGPGWETSQLLQGPLLIRSDEKVASAGSCFAANIVPHLEQAGFQYIRRDLVPESLKSVSADNFNYSRFSAAYGNIYTVRQALQMIERALGRFKPAEDRWIMGRDLVIDPFRPGLKYPATSEREFEALTARHLASVLDVVRSMDVFIFTLGLTEAWVSKIDGAVFPACPGTVSGVFDPERHVFHNFSVGEIGEDIDGLVSLVREINPRVRFIFTVSPVPLVATATGQHVLLASMYSKAVLRVAAEAAAARWPEVHYFPAFEIVTGPQAPFDFFENDRREPSAEAIRTVMRAFLSRCEAGDLIDAGTSVAHNVRATLARSSENSAGHSDTNDFARQLARAISEAQCEEEAAGISIR